MFISSVFNVDVKCFSCIYIYRYEKYILIKVNGETIILKGKMAS